MGHELSMGVEEAMKKRDYGFYDRNHFDENYYDFF